MISGKTTVIAHLGYPTEAFKAPMIYNPYFDHAGIDAVVVPSSLRITRRTCDRFSRRQIFAARS